MAIRPGVWQKADHVPLVDGLPRLHLYIFQLPFPIRPDRRHGLKSINGRVPFVADQPDAYLPVEGRLLLLQFHLLHRPGTDRLKGPQISAGHEIDSRMLESPRRIGAPAEAHCLIHVGFFDI